MYRKSGSLTTSESATETSPLTGERWVRDSSRRSAAKANRPSRWISRVPRRPARSGRPINVNQRVHTEPRPQLQRGRTVREQDKGRVEAELDLGELELGQLLGELEDGADELGLDRVGRQEGVDGQQRVAEEDGVLRQVVVARHAQHHQLEAARLQQHDLVVLRQPHEARHHLGELDYVLDHGRQPLRALQPQLFLRLAKTKEKPSTNPLHFPSVLVPPVQRVLTIQRVLQVQRPSTSRRPTISTRLTVSTHSFCLPPFFKCPLQDQSTRLCISTRLTSSTPKYFKASYNINASYSFNAFILFAPFSSAPYKINQRVFAFQRDLQVQRVLVLLGVFQVQRIRSV